MDINRKQFLGSLFAGAAFSCLPAFATNKMVESEPTEFEKCRNDILYFVDNYLEVNDRLHGKLKMSPQQREYLKRISTTPDFFFCAKGRQVGISTANNVFAYWKSIFFGPDHYVFIVEPSVRMKENVKSMYWDVSNSGAFMPLSNRVHFITPRTMMTHDLTNENNTYILDEFDCWNEYNLDRLSKQYLNLFLGGLLFKHAYPNDFKGTLSKFIVPSAICSYDNIFVTLLRNADDSRKLALPSPMRGLKA